MIKIIVFIWQEELSLYRNGATNQDLMEMITEKEGELAATKSALAEKNESLRKLAKTSQGVLSECDRLNDFTHKLQDENKTLSSQLSHKISELECATKNLEGCKEMLSDTQEDLISLQKKYEFATEDIEKLQQRCALLVKEKTERGAALDEEKRLRASDVKGLRVGCDRCCMAFLVNANPMYLLYLLVCALYGICNISYI